ncbi:MAG TPA: ATP-binding protein [Spirochaetota bacterium]|nr:ATP-binding protein [Spirochaetota bacterium]HNT13012.1 ATP-binding protein [Spirochaetota bacterium]
MSATAIILHSLLALAAFELIVMTHIRTRRLAAVFATSTLAASIPLLIEIAALYGIVPAHVLTTARPALHAPFILSFGWLLNTYFLRHSAISMRALAAGSLALVVLSLALPGAIALQTVPLSLFALYAAAMLYGDITAEPNATAVRDRLVVIGLLLAQTGALCANLVIEYEPLAAMSNVVLLALVSIRHFTGEFNRTAVMAHNVLISKDLNRQLVHSIGRLSQKIEQLRQVISDKEAELLQLSKHASLAEITAGVAHELTQPLTGIKAIAQNMIDDITDGDVNTMEAVAELLKICAMVDKSSSIINHIRHFSGKSKIVRSGIDLNAVVLESIDLVSYQFSKHAIDIVLDLPPEAAIIHGDAIALEQTIINLLLNARDAILEKRSIAPEDISGTITIRTTIDRSTVALAIEDNGTGIPPHTLANIWSPFFTTKKKSNGTGVGLSISRKIITEHDGTVSVESTPDVGTRFIITLPLKQETIAASR